MKKLAFLASLFVLLSLALTSCDSDNNYFPFNIDPTYTPPADGIYTEQLGMFLTDKALANDGIVNNLKERCPNKTTSQYLASFLIIGKDEAYDNKENIAVVNTMYTAGKPIVVMYNSSPEQMKAWLDHFDIQVQYAKTLVDQAYKNAPTNNHIATIFTYNKMIVIDMDGNNDVYKTGGYIMDNLNKQYINQK